MKTLIETYPSGSGSLGVETDPSGSLQIGMRAGPWVIERELGRGGMGAVYAVRHEKIGKRAALKVMHRRLSQPAMHAKRMELEATVVNEIRHPNIVDIFDVGTTDDGRPYIVMEQLAGRSLEDCELGFEDAIWILIQVSNALIAAHAAGVVHRDLKPDNIFLADRVGEPPRVVVLDWGIARMLNVDARQTLEGQLLGTPQYLAPEQARGEQATPKTDVYSLGVMAYQFVLLRPPFDAATPLDVMAMHLFVPPPAPRGLWPEIPPRLDRLLAEMLAKAPEQRPTMEEVAARLAVIADDLANRHAPAAVSHRFAPVVPRKRRRWPIVVGVLATASVAGLFLGAMANDGPRRSEPAVARPKVVEAAPPEKPAAPTRVNPVLEDCADPAVGREGAQWYLTCTGARRGNTYPIYESANLEAWRPVGWIFPAGTRPAWADGNYWSPEVHAIPGGFGAYFTMRVRDGRNAIGVATSKAVTGPYRDDGPLVAPPQGASDPHLFVDGGRRYLYFKSEDAPSIQAQPLTDDGLATAGEPRRVLDAHGNVEAPWVIHTGEYFYLFYSSGQYCDPDYAVQVARSRSPFGPFEKRSQPLLTTGASWAAPGHVAVVAPAPGEWLIVYHAYRIAEGIPSCDGEQAGRRHVRVDRLELDDGWPVVRASL